MALDIFKRGELWGDGSGGVAEIPETFDTSSAWRRTGVDSGLVVAIVFEGVEPDTVELQVDWSPDGGASSYPLDGKSYDGDGIFDVADGVFRFQNPTNGNHTLRFLLPEYIAFRVKVRRSGGDATSKALLEGLSRSPFSYSSGISISGVTTSDANTYNAVCQATDAEGDCIVIAGGLTGGDPTVRKIDITSDYECIGVIDQKVTITTCKVRTGGISRDVYTGLTPGAMYLVSSSGRLTSTPPTPSGGYIIAQHVGMAISASAINVGIRTPIIRT